MRENASSNSKAKLFVTIYVAIVVVGFLLGFLSVFIPFLTQCLTLFENNVCSPIGMHAVVLVSFPGYLVVGFLEAFLPLPSIISLPLVGIVSFMFYWYVGYFFDKKVYRHVTKANGPTVFIGIAFCVLLLVFLYLWRLTAL